MILAIHQQYLLLVKRYDAVNIVRTVGIGEIDAIKTYVAKADAIVRHILHEHLGRDSRCAVCLHIVEVAVKEAAQVRHEGYHLRQLAHIEVIDTERHILLSLLVRRRIKLKACAIVGQEVNQSVKVSVVSQGNEVVRIKREATISNGRIERSEVSAEAVGKQVKCQTEVHTLLSLGIIEGHIGIGSRLRQRSMYLRHEGDYAVPWAVSHTSIQCNATILLPDLPINTIKQDGAGIERMHVPITIQALLGRGIKIQREVAETVTCRMTEDVAYRVLLPTGKLHLEMWQQGAKHILLDAKAVHLLLQLTTKAIDASQQ